MKLAFRSQALASTEKEEGKARTPSPPFTLPIKDEASRAGEGVGASKGTSMAIGRSLVSRLLASQEVQRKSL